VTSGRLAWAYSESKVLVAQPPSAVFEEQLRGVCLPIAILGSGSSSSEPAAKILLGSRTHSSDVLIEAFAGFTKMHRQQRRIGCIDCHKSARPTSFPSRFSV